MDIYPSQKLSRVLENFRKKYPEHYEIVRNFSEDLIAQGISELRVRSYVHYLRRILDVVKKDFREFTKEDVRKVIVHYQELVNRGEFSDSVVFEVKKTLKRFFRWFNRDDLVNWFTIGSVETKVSPHDLITEDEFRKMLNACLNSRDRAFISLLYETGARIGEIASMRVKDVSFDEFGAVVWLPKSKTIKRRLRIVYSTKFLSMWLSDHPLKEDPEAPLWIRLTGKNRTAPMQYKDFQIQLKKIAKRAGIKKRIYPHLFRHTRATRILGEITESIGAKYMGWVPGSRMVKVYLHLTDKDVENAILEMHGLKKESERDLEVRKCVRCSFINPGDSRFCSNCGLPLTSEASHEIRRWEEEEKKLLEILSRPEFIKLIADRWREIEELKKIAEERIEGELRDGGSLEG
jgi:integrase